LLPSLLHPGLAYMPMGTMGSNDGRKGGPIVLTCMYMHVEVNKYTKTVTLHYKFTTNQKRNHIAEINIRIISIQLHYVIELILDT
jgi:predicted solute-binding protein